MEGALRLRAERRGGGLSVLEQHHGWDRRDPVTLGEGRLLVDVDLRELELAGPLLDDLVEHGRHHVTRLAPLRPEVDEDRRVGGEDLLIEALLGYDRCVCHRVIPFESRFGKGNDRLGWAVPAHS
jgi:hypothetical protein